VEGDRDDGLFIVLTSNVTRVANEKRFALIRECVHTATLGMFMNEVEAHDRHREG
jgi:hypothetical protein